MREITLRVIESREVKDGEDTESGDILWSGPIPKTLFHLFMVDFVVSARLLPALFDGLSSCRSHLNKRVNFPMLLVQAQVRSG